MDKEIYYRYFEEKVLPCLSSLEDYRKNIVKDVIIKSFVMFTMGILLAVLFIYLSFRSDFGIFFLPFILFFMYVFFIKSIIYVMLKGKEYQNWLVKNILPYFLEPVANFKFWPKNNDTLSILNSGLFRNFEAREDVSAIFGIYKNTNIIISNTQLIKPVKRNIFKGTLIQLELPSAINNHIVILSKNETKHNNYRQINPKIEDMKKYVYVFAKNNNDLNILTENFWNIIKRFGEAYTAKGFELSFNKDTVLIAIRQKHPWQFGFLFKSLLKAKNYDDLIERFIVIYDLIDCL